MNKPVIMLTKQTKYKKEKKKRVRLKSTRRLYESSEIKHDFLHHNNYVLAVCNVANSVCIVSVIMLVIEYSLWLLTAISLDRTSWCSGPDCVTDKHGPYLFRQHSSSWCVAIWRHGPQWHHCDSRSAGVSCGFRWHGTSHKVGILHFTKALATGA